MNVKVGVEGVSVHCSKCPI